MIPQHSVIDRCRFLTLCFLSLGQLTNWCQALLNSTEVDDIEAAVSDHLVSDADKETSHTLIGVVVTSDSVNHLNRVHKGGKGVLDRFGVAIIQRFNELFKRLQILDVVFSLVESFSHTQLN